MRDVTIMTMSKIVTTRQRILLPNTDLIPHLRFLTVYYQEDRVITFEDFVTQVAPVSRSIMQIILFFTVTSL